MKIGMRIISAASALLLMMTALASCSAGRSDVYENGDSYPSGKEDYVYDEGFGGNYAGDYDDGYKGEADFVPETEAPEGGSSLGSLDAVTETARKRIQYVTVTMESLEYDRALSEIKMRATAAGGYIESSSESGKDIKGTGSRRAYLVFRIPAENLDSFAGDIEEVGNVLTLETSTRDVTESYFDIEARLASLESQRDRYMELLSEAKSMDEILIIDNALTDVLYQIESYTGTLNKYDSLVAYSTVTLTLSEVIELTEPEPPVIKEPTFGERIKEAFGDSIEAFGDMIEAIVIGIVAAAPFLVIPAFAIVIIIIAVRGKLRKQRRRRAEAAAEKGE